MVKDEPTQSGLALKSILLAAMLVDCSDVKQSFGDAYQAGVYELDNEKGVYCDPDGWTVIQSRGQFGNPVDFFYRDWAEYLRGFGTPGCGSINKMYFG